MLRRNRPSLILQHIHKPNPGKALIILPLLLISIQSCYNDPNFLGNNLIPEEDIYAVKTDTLFEVSAYSIKTDTILATSGYLGYYNSEIFGSTKGALWVDTCQQPPPRVLEGQPPSQIPFSST